MEDIRWLSLITFLPLAGVLFILMARDEKQEIVDRNARWIALWVSLITFLVSLVIWINFDTTSAGFQFVE